MGIRGTNRIKLMKSRGSGLGMVPLVVQSPKSDSAYVQWGSKREKVSPIVVESPERFSVLRDALEGFLGRDDPAAEFTFHGDEARLPNDAKGYMQQLRDFGEAMGLEYTDLSTNDHYHEAASIIRRSDDVDGNIRAVVIRAKFYNDGSNIDIMPIDANGQSPTDTDGLKIEIGYEQSPIYREGFKNVFKITVWPGLIPPDRVRTTTHRREMDAVAETLLTALEDGI